MRGVCVQEAINIETLILLSWTDGYTTQEIFQTSDTDCITELLCACAWAPPGSVDVNYHKAVS